MYLRHFHYLRLYFTKYLRIETVENIFIQKFIDQTMSNLQQLAACVQMSDEEYSHEQQTGSDARTIALALASSTVPPLRLASRNELPLQTQVSSSGSATLQNPCPSGGTVPPTPRTSKGKQVAWSDLEYLGATMATVNLPDACINGSKQKKTFWHGQLKKEFDNLYISMKRKYVELNDITLQRQWLSRPGRIIAYQGAKALKTCRKLFSYLQIVENANLIGGVN